MENNCQIVELHGDVDLVVIEAWLAKTARNSAATGSEYRRNVQSFRRWLGLPLAEVSKFHLDSYEAALMHRGLKPRSIRTYLAAVRSLLSFGHATMPELYPRNAGAAYEPPKPTPRDEMDWRRIVEVAPKVIAACDKPLYRLAMRVAWEVGLRSGAVVALLNEDVIALDAEPHWVLRAANKGGGVYYPALSPELAADLLALPREPGEHLFPWQQWSLQHAVAVAAAKVGPQAEGFTVHSFRHALASDALSSGQYTHAEVAAGLGHAGINALTHYTHIEKRRALSDCRDIVLSA